jgi:15-cis-phytoene synthase
MDLPLVQLHHWEYQLLTWAEEALRTSTLHSYFSTDKSTLEEAYQQCDAITRHYSRTFSMASGLLPTEKRRAARALYAFCRITDNIVDNSQPEAQRLSRLEEWRKTVSDPELAEAHPVALAWLDTQRRFQIPSGYAEQLIDGVARDLTQRRYATFGDLAGYAYGVASTVGLMAMHIVGFKSAEALPYAVKLGVALQLTNILRDIGEDWQNGRLYLPQDELDRFGVTEHEISSHQVTPQWRELMQFQIERNRRLYQESWEGIQLLDSDGRMAIGAAAGLYRAILRNIEHHDFDVFSHRARVSTWGKLARLPLIWWQMA